LSHADAAYYILYGETQLKYTKPRLNDSMARGRRDREGVVGDALREDHDVARLGFIALSFQK
jgi:hypothetical protein